MKIIHALFLTTVLMSCGSDSELQKSVFIPDPTSPGLPKYSEWGYNTFGVYFDRVAFVSNSTVPLKVFRQNNRTSLIFSGTMANGNGFYDANNYSITFSLEGYNPETYQDLVAFNNVVLDLTDPLFEVVITNTTGTHKLEILEGEVHIKRAQYLLVDKKPEEVILSGVFAYKALLDGVPVTFSDGRFDVSVGNDNFYNI
jgi:hypothetical protein